MAKLGPMLKQLKGERNRTQKELERLDEAIVVFDKLVRTNSRGGVRKGRRARRKISAAGRARISRAQKARWAKLRRATKG